MRTVRAVLILIAAAALLWGVAADDQVSRSIIARVERVSDGNTVIALTAEATKFRIRLLGIDAPEIPHGAKPGQPYGAEG